MLRFKQIFIVSYLAFVLSFWSNIAQKCLLRLLALIQV